MAALLCSPSPLIGPPNHLYSHSKATCKTTRYHNTMIYPCYHRMAKCYIRTGYNFNTTYHGTTIRLLHQNNTQYHQRSQYMSWGENISTNYYTKLLHILNRYKVYLLFLTNEVELPPSLHTHTQSGIISSLNLLNICMFFTVAP